MKINFEKQGKGKPLLLIHGLGGSIHSWDIIIDDLAKTREVVTIDLPGFGNSPPLAGKVSIGTLSDALKDFLEQQGLLGIDAVGTSMGARLVLELVRRGGILGAVVSLDPGGFWQGWEKHAFFISIKVSIKLIRLIHPLLPKLLNTPQGRRILLLQFSVRPEQLPPEVPLQELNDYVKARSFDELLYTLVYGEEQKGLPKGTLKNPLVIGWGRNDYVCLPKQANRAMKLFPDAKLHWFENCGHFPQWDQTKETVRLILATTQ